MRWTATENAESPCIGLRVDDLPRKLPANIHILHNSDGILSVLAENVAGVLPCKNGHEILIEPKYKGIQPIEMLRYINNISGINTEVDRIRDGSGDVGLQTLTDSFARALLNIQGNGKKIKRLPRDVITNSVTGHVNWLRVEQERQRTGTIQITTRIRQATNMIPENIILAAAAKKALPLYAPDHEYFDVLYSWAKLLENTNTSFRELFAMQRRLNEQSLSGAHAFYYAPIMIAKMILGFLDATVETEITDSILFNMPGLYEEYVRTAFQRIGVKYGVTIQKGLVPRSFLFCNGDCEMIPDIVIYDGTTIKAILDVKYKEPDSKDYYQIYSYMKYAETQKAYVISPVVMQDTEIATFDGGKLVYIRADNTEANNVEQIAEKMIRSVV